MACRAAESDHRIELAGYHPILLLSSSTDEEILRMQIEHSTSSDSDRLKLTRPRMLRNTCEIRLKNARSKRFQNLLTT